MADINAIADQIQGLTLLEASQLVKLLEEKLGVSAAAAAPVAAAGGGAGGGGSSGRREDRVHGGSDRGGRQQDQRDQGCARSHQPRPERSQGPGGWRSQAGQGRRQQGRSRDHQEEVHRRWRDCRSEVSHLAIGCSCDPASASRMASQAVGRCFFGDLTWDAKSC